MFRCVSQLLDKAVFNLKVKKTLKFFSSTTNSGSKASLKPVIDPQKIRNFCIIAHIDHGKSTLADRLMEITNTIKGGHSQYLDKLKVEKERGITVKAQSVSMYYNYNGEKFLLNLIDTPGHVDFTYEVSRSMYSCQGALLLVDATQGIQAQTLSNYELATASKLKILSVINKIDVHFANVEATKESMIKSFQSDPNDIYYVSALKGLNCELLLPAICEKIPPLKVEFDQPLKAFLIDSWFVKDKGVVLLLQVRSGFIKKGTKIMSCAFKKRFDVFEVGILSPEETEYPYLSPGMVGYAMTNMKSVGDARIGDTFFEDGSPVTPLEGFKPPKQLVYAGIYPEVPDDYANLEKCIYKLGLTDPSVSITKESSAALGNGFRCGFLGILHMEVFKQRLDDEYHISSLITTPSVPHRCKLKSGKMFEIENALMAPDPVSVEYYEEPVALASLLVPKFALSQIISLCQDRRGVQTQFNPIDEEKFYLKYEFPLSEIITDFFDKVKSLTKGYGSLDYDFVGFKKANIKKLTILLMGEEVDALSFMVHVDKAETIGRSLCQKLKEKLPQQLFTVAIQAQLGSKIIAREEVKAMKKNVTAKCYGGDYSRKKKLIERQKEGKKQMRMIGRVEVGKDTFKDILKY